MSIFIHQVIYKYAWTILQTRFSAHSHPRFPADSVCCSFWLIYWWLCKNITPTPKRLLSSSNCESLTRHLFFLSFSLSDNRALAIKGWLYVLKALITGMQLIVKKIDVMYNSMKKIIALACDWRNLVPSVSPYVCRHTWTQTHAMLLLLLPW